MKITIDARGPSSRILDEMAETKYRIAEITRGYESGLRLTDSESDDDQSGKAGLLMRKKAEMVDLYAERNGEMHVLCQQMLDALECLGAEPEMLHGFRSTLHNVPQCRR